MCSFFINSTARSIELHIHTASNKIESKELCSLDVDLTQSHLKKVAEERRKMLGMKKIAARAHKLPISYSAYTSNDQS